MIRIACLGDSHLPAIKLGWDDIRAGHEDVELTFFGAPQDRLLNLAPQDRALLPQDDSLREIMVMTSGRDRIDIDAFEVFVICALDLTVRRLVFAMAGHRPFRYRRVVAPHLISGAVYDEILPRIYANALALRMAALIRGIAPRAKIVLVPQPMPSENIALSAEQETGDEDLWRQIVEHQYQAGIAADFRNVLDDLARHDFHLVTQPGNTLAGPCLTRHEFSAGSVRMTGDFGVPHPDSDFIHMNRCYGARLLPGILNKARSLAGT